jgi:hypothetical protein
VTSKKVFLLVACHPSLITVFKLPTIMPSGGINKCCVLRRVQASGALAA